MSMIQSRALLANCSVKRWNPRVLDRNVTKQVQVQHGASEDSGDFRKALVEKAAIKALNTSAGNIRALHYKLTLPWDDEGARLLPSKTYQKYQDEMRILRYEDERLRNDFVAVYPQLVASAKVRLGTMYDPNDFPDVTELPAKFDVKLSFTPVPDAADFRADVADEAAQDIKEQIEAERDAKFQGAMRDCFRRVEAVVSRISNTLSKEEPRIFETLITNAQDIVKAMADLNLADDPKLNEFCESLDAMLPKNTAILKADPELRKQIASDADELLAKMVGYV